MDIDEKRAIIEADRLLLGQAKTGQIQQ